ncbi:MAG: LCP family protein [Lachnospiraceae bacterium]|nr:LCP family protein [Lachnospiraceae bacterium]
MANNDKEKKKKTKKKMKLKTKRKIKIAILILEGLILALFAGMMIFYIWYSGQSADAKSEFKKNMLTEFTQCSVGRSIISCSTKGLYEDKVMDKDFNKDNVVKNEGLKETDEKYLNIALFGIDARGTEFDNATHSDTIIVVNVNMKTKEVKMVSVYRDTMLEISDLNGNVMYGKANLGFFRGGAEGAINMLNTNLDLDITDYAVVNFSGLIKIIDALGGIDTTITEKEREYINGYMTETRKITGMDAPDLTTSGQVHLNGLQATAYCRIRYTTYYAPDGKEYSYDLGRTARQRFVLEQLFSKAKQAGASEIVNIANSIINYNTENERIVKTSLTFDEIMDLIPIVLEMNISGNTGFPFTLSAPTIDGQSYVVANGLEYNVGKLHEYLFEDEKYEATDTVKEISEYIKNYSGCDTQRLPEDLEKETEEDSTGQSNSEQNTEMSN